MKVRLYSTVTVRQEQVKGARNIPGAKSAFYDSVSGTTTYLMPIPESERKEELLGEFDAETILNGKRVVVHGQRDINLPANTLTKETETNIFRAEVVG